MLQSVIYIFIIFIKHDLPVIIIMVLYKMVVFGKWWIVGKFLENGGFWKDIDKNNTSHKRLEDIFLDELSYERME